MTAETTAGQDGLHVLIEIQASSRITVAAGPYDQGESYKKDEAATKAPYAARFRNRLVRTSGESGMRAVYLIQRWPADTG